MPPKSDLGFGRMHGNRNLKRGVWIRFSRDAP